MDSLNIRHSHIVTSEYWKLTPLRIKNKVLTRIENTGIREGIGYERYGEEYRRHTRMGRKRIKLLKDGNRKMDEIRHNKLIGRPREHVTDG